jgi:hypothetical protein
LIPLKFELATTSNISTGTADVGVYHTEKGAVIDVDCLADGMSTATAGRALDAMASVGIANFQKTLADLAGIDSAIYPSVDVAVKFITTAPGAQAIALRGIFLQKY